MMKLGASKPWPEAMALLTGQRKMDVGPILEYFQPLIKWLEKENYHERPGWSPACPEAVNTGSRTPGKVTLCQTTAASERLYFCFTTQVLMFFITLFTRL